MKKNISSLVIFLMIMVFMTGCGSQGNEGDSEQIELGIVQIVEHPSLNTIRESMVESLAEAGYVDQDNIIIDYQNAQGDQTNLKTICQKFVSHEYDMIIAIATPSAQAAAGATSEIPVVFAACTDPISAGLVQSMENPGKNVTGTSDAISAEKIMQLAQRLTPGFETVGALYNSGEVNSVSMIDELKDFAEVNGLTVVEATVTNSSEVQQATQSLTGKADIIFSPIDNTIASAMPIVAKLTKEQAVPMYVGADSMVKDGGLATYGIDYEILGDETAKMVVEILEGADPAVVPVKTMDKMNIYLNQTTANEIGIEIPTDVMNEAAEIFE